MLNYDIAIRIVHRLISIFNKDINIIGIDGVIIASSNSKRENTYHEAARITANSNRNIIITENNKHMYRGCKEGVNMPIIYNNNVIGVIGITGTAEEVLPYAPLIKEIVELIVNEIDNEHSQKVKIKKKKDFFIDIIQGIDSQDIYRYYSRAKLLEIDIENMRKMVVFKWKIDEENTYSKIETLLFNILNNLNVEMLNLDNKKIILLFNGTKDIDKYISTLIEKLKLNNISRYKFIVGDECKNIIDYEKAYSQICLVESLEQEYNYKNIINVNEYGINLLIKGVSKRFKDIYIEDYFSQLFVKDTELSSEMINTIKIYFTNNMLVSETAKAMFIHRNTVVYRLNKFKNLYGIDLTKPYECAKVYLALLINDEKIMDIGSQENLKQA